MKKLRFVLLGLLTCGLLPQINASAYHGIDKPACSGTGSNNLLVESGSSLDLDGDAFGSNNTLNILQDGNIVIRDGSNVTMSMGTYRFFSSDTACSGTTCNLRLHEDGNLVLKKGSNVKWSAGLSNCNNIDDYLRIYPDRFEIHNGTGDIDWVSHPNLIDRSTIITDSGSTSTFTPQKNIYLGGGITPFEGAVNYEQIPNTNILIGRRKRDGGSHWDLTHNHINWNANRITFQEKIHINERGSLEIESAYDPSVLIHNDDTYIAFECYIQTPPSRVSSCIGIYNSSNHTINDAREIVLGNQTTNHKHSASVPKLFKVGNDIFIGWTKVHQKKIDGKWIWHGVSSRLTHVSDINNDTFNTNASSGIQNWKNPEQPDIDLDVFSVKILNNAVDGQTLYITGAELPEGCLKPADDVDVDGCYKMFIYRKNLSHISNFPVANKRDAIARLLRFTKLDLPEILENTPHEYSKIIRKDDNSVPLLIANFTNNYPIQGMMSFDFLDKDKAKYLTHLYWNLLDHHPAFPGWFVHPLRTSINGLFDHWENNATGTTAEIRRDYITLLYRTLLEREPSTAEVNGHFASSLTLQQIRNNFVNGPEYTQLILSKGLTLD